MATAIEGRAHLLAKPAVLEGERPGKSRPRWPESASCDCINGEGDIMFTDIPNSKKDDGVSRSCGPCRMQGRPVQGAPDVLAE